MKNFTYAQATGYLDKCLIFGIKPGLSRIKKILDMLGYPKIKTDFIHIVGTNGKTSTTVITAVILQEHGIRCGYHISPHITEYTERLWYCGSQIKKVRFAKLLSDLFPLIEDVNATDPEGPMTQFEIIAAMAFKLAIDENLDVMVLEAGMGGRWDATNAACSKIAGLTNVSLEHTAVLGKTIKKIAIEKSKVIKHGAKVATLSNDEKVLEVLRNEVCATKSRLYIYGADFYIMHQEKNYLKGWEVQIKGIFSEYKNLFLPLAGNYQPQNLCLAVALSELYMHSLGRDVSSELLKPALKKARIKGRFQVLRKEPVVIADTSHNPGGIKNFVKNINENFKTNKKIIIFSVLKDKDYKKMLEAVCGIADVLILTSSNVARSLDPGAIENLFYKLRDSKSLVSKKMPGEVIKMDSISNSLNYALNTAGINDIICITGSITNLENIV
ncbi:MAG: hypothetical protein FJW68_01955 [Actinobacteria bacterium]|nr:hypothetical protein [Actinomycetota bacterium]